MLKLRFGFLLMCFPILTIGLKAQDSRTSISEVCDDYCPVCRDGKTDNDTLMLFHELHMESRKKDMTALHSRLTEARLQGVFKTRDTLEYFTGMMLGHALYALKLPRESIRVYQDWLLKWEGFHLTDPQHALTEIANNFSEIGEYEQALSYYQKIVNSKSFQATPSLQDAVFVGMGLCYQKIAEPKIDSAIYYLESAIEVQKKLNDSVDLAKSYLNLGSLYFEQYQDAKADAYWKRSLKLANELNLLDIQDDLHYNLAMLMEETGRPNEALHHYKQYLNYQDSIWNRDKLWELAEQKKQFEVQLKEDEITILEQDKALQQADLDKRRSELNALWGVAIGLVFIVLLITVLFITTRRKNSIIRKQKEHLDQLNETKNQLFSIVSHDLRTPLQALGRNNLILQHEITQTEHPELQSLLSRNQQGIDNTYRLLDNLLHWSLSQTENLFLQEEKLQLKAIIDQVHFNFQQAISGKSLVFVNNIPADVFVMADTNTLKVVLRNLLDNAIKFTPENGQITCEVHSTEGEKVLFAVANTGPSIPHKLRDSIFGMPSEKQRGADTYGKTSSGLGLFLCRELLRKNQGSINLDPETEEGARFIIGLKHNQHYE